MKKLMMAVLAGLMSLAIGAYAAEDMKKDMKKDPGMAKGDMAKGEKAAPAPKAEKKAKAEKGDMKDEPKKGRRARAAKG